MCNSTPKQLSNLFLAEHLCLLLFWLPHHGLLLGVFLVHGRISNEDGDWLAGEWVSGFQVLQMCQFVFGM